MSADRERLAAALTVELSDWVTFRAGDGKLSIGHRPARTSQEIADALLPVVQDLVKEGAAAELRAAADWLSGGGADGSLPGGSAPDETTDGLSWMKDVGDRDSALDWCQMSLHDRADALTAGSEANR